MKRQCLARTDLEAGRATVKPTVHSASSSQKGHGTDAEGLAANLQVGMMSLANSICNGRLC